MSGIRIGIASGGRFHLLDLARELHALGHSVRFYSYVPKQRAFSFGLSEQCHVDLLPLMTPIVGTQRLAPDFLPERMAILHNQVLDRLVTQYLEPCDVFVCMSGTFIKAPLFARQRYGAKVIVERGSKHILEQRAILASIPGLKLTSDYTVRRELQSYRIADRISVPARHVADSFEQQSPGLSTIINPYGVNLQNFPLLPRRDASERLTLVMAGRWSYRKGVDILVKAIRSDDNFALVHVGELGDVPFPSGSSQFLHMPPVDQRRLCEVYATADAFVLASREEGLAVVQPQALAAGLPLVCTEDTGGADLAHTEALRDRITVVRSGDPEALLEGLRTVGRRARGRPAFKALTETDRQALTWSAYAKRYEQNLYNLLQ